MTECAVGYCIKCPFGLETDAKTIFELAQQMEAPPSTMRVDARRPRKDAQNLEFCCASRRLWSRPPVFGDVAPDGGLACMASDRADESVGPR